MATFEDILASFKALGELADDSAKRAAPLVEDALRATAQAGTDPLGQRWQPKKDGSAPLEHAAAAISVKSYGSIVRAVLTGPTVFHHFGGGRNPRRPVLPDPGTIPPGVELALRKAATAAFAKAVG